MIVIAATNRADILDPALLRPGRFDRKVFVDLPDIAGREKILQVHARGKPIASEVSFKDTARLTAGFSGADLENLINEAAIFAARRSKRTIGLLEFQDAFDRVVMGPERQSRVMSEDDKMTVAYHETGHAVVSFFLPNTDPVQKITIVPRGRAGGFVMSLPEDRALHSREFFEDQIAMALGGRASEEHFFGRITTGASNDLQQATRLARAMVMEYGMSSKLGLPTYGSGSHNPFLGREMGWPGGGREYSEDAAQAIAPGGQHDRLFPHAFSFPWSDLSAHCGQSAASHALQPSACPRPADRRGAAPGRAASRPSARRRSSTSPPPR